MWRAVESELSHQGDRPVYRAVGRAFVLEDKATLATQSETQLKELSEMSDKFEKQNVFLMAKVRENEKQLGELMRSKN
jgi:chaperonin cofactor prefoldin